MEGGLDILIGIVALARWLALSIVPTLVICRRVGKTKWWAAATVIPILGQIPFMIVLAYTHWDRKAHMQNFIPRD